MGYVRVSSFKDVQVVSPTRVLDVERVGFVTTPTGIYAEFPVDYQTWLASGGGNIGEIASIADAIENLIAGSAATDASFVQDVEASGLLVDAWDVTVTYDPPGGLVGPFTTEIRIPLALFSATADPFFGHTIGGVTFGGKSPAELVDEAYQALVATAG